MNCLTVDNPINNLRHHSLPPQTLSKELPSLSQSSSTGITNGYFANNIMRKIEKSSNLKLNKVTIKKQRVGRGTSAYVHLAMYNQNEIALKEYKFKDSEFNDRTLAEFENELNILDLANHPNIIQLYGFHLNIHKRILNLAFEYSKQGNLFQLIHPLFDVIEYDYKIILNILFDIAKGMKYLHSLNIINRDLKPKNLLIFDDFHIKITDFGESVVVDYDCYNFEEYRLYDEVGTDGYKAPEVIEIDINNGYIGYKIDIFSFGTICYELYTKKFVGGIKYLRNFEHLKQNLHQKIIPKDIPQELRCLISDCWQFNADKRPAFNQILDRLNKMIM